MGAWPIIVGDMSDDPNDFRFALSARGVARLLGVSPDLVLEEIRTGRLPAYRLGRRRLLVRREDVEAWLAARRVRPTAHAERIVERVLQREAEAGP